jgi:hypothetical protein
MTLEFKQMAAEQIVAKSLGCITCVVISVTETGDVWHGCC